MEGLGPQEAGHARACDSSNAEREGDEEGERRSICSSISLSHGALLNILLITMLLGPAYHVNYLQKVSMKACMNACDQVMLACRCHVPS